MKFQQLTETLETQRASVSKAKADLEKIISASRSEKLDADVVKKLDATMNALSKMLSLSHEGVGYDVEAVTVKDVGAFHTGQLMLKEGFSEETQISIAVGILNYVNNEIDKLSVKNDEVKYKVIINQNTNERVELSKKYYAAQKAASKANNEALKAIEKAYPTEVEENTEE